MQPLPDLDVFYGELTVARGLVYARLPRPAEDAGLSLSGQVRGPRCLHAQTLPASAPLVDQGPGPTLLAQALVPDPVFWSPDLPAIYDVTVNLLRGGQPIATARREIGLRSLGVRGRKLLLAGKNWVLRGVSTESTPERLPRAWHEAAAALIADDTDAEALAEASQWGALSVVHIDGPGVLAVDRLRQLAQFPGAGIAVPLRPLPAGFDRSAAPNLLLAQLLGRDDPLAIDSWADLLIIAAEAREHLAAAAAMNKPVIVSRSLAAPVDLREARAACDKLQRDLAPIGQFAGYIV